MINVIIFGVVFYIVLKIIDEYFKFKNYKKAKYVKYLNSIVHMVTVEEHHGLKYWFDLDNNIFLSQGSTVSEIIDNVKSRFPNHVFLVDGTGLSKKTDWKPIVFKDFTSVSEFMNKLL